MAYGVLPWICREAISKNSSKRMFSGMDLLRVPWLVLHHAAAAAFFSIAPDHRRTTSKDGSKRPWRGFDLPRVPQLVLHRTAVATLVSNTPGHHRAIAKNGSKRV